MTERTGKTRAYLRVSTTEQADSGLGLAAQRQAIEGWAERASQEHIEWYTDAGLSGASLNRPAVRRLIADLRRGDVLVVSKLDRISRSLLDFAALLQQSQREGWSIVALDLGLDLATPTGRLVAGVMASVAEWERATIGARTADALAQAKRQGRLPGRRSSLPRHVQDRLLALAETGMTLAERAAVLNGEGLRTATGLEWGTGIVYASTRSAVLERDARAVLDVVA
jgi:DNA invertase Pin-like site-specific DNA recombinase